MRKIYREVIADIAQVTNPTDTRIELTDLCHRLIGQHKKYRGMETSTLADVLRDGVGVKLYPIQSHDARAEATTHLGVYPAALFKAVAS